MRIKLIYVDFKRRTNHVSNANTSNKHFYTYKLVVVGEYEPTFLSANKDELILISKLCG